LNLLEPDSLSPPPFSFYEDEKFTETMSLFVPDERVRDDVINSIGLDVTRALVRTASPKGITVLTGTDYSLLVTEPQKICPSLRVVYSVQDEPPTRRINFHRADLSGRTGGWGF
jgi:hypothetical protein